MHQTGLPISDLQPQEIAREKSLGGAIGLCAKAAGFEGKQVQDFLKLDKAQSPAGRAAPRVSSGTSWLP